MGGQRVYLGEITREFQGQYRVTYLNWVMVSRGGRDAKMCHFAPKGKKKSKTRHEIAKLSQ